MSCGGLTIRRRTQLVWSVCVLACLAMSTIATAQIRAQAQMEVVRVYDSAEAQLSGVDNIAFVPPDRILVVDRNHTAIVEFGRDGGFRRNLGRSGEGPGEFRGLWNAGGDSSAIWGADVRLSRFVVFDTAGRHTETVALSPLQSRLPARTIPVSRLSEDVYLVAAETAVQSQEVDLLRVRASEGGLSVEDTVDRISVADRSLVVSFPNGDGEAMLLDPFARSGFFAASASGHRVAFLDQPAPADGQGRLAIRMLGADGAERWSTAERYELRAVTEEDVDRWLGAQGGMIRMAVERGLYASPAGAREHVREALGPVEWMPGVPVRGRGLLSRSLFVGAEGAVWMVRSPSWASSKEWLIVRADDEETIRATTVTVPEGIRLYDAKGKMAWGVRTSEYGVPTIVELRSADSRDEARP